MFLSTHSGTHMDAPSHFKHSASIDVITVDRFVCYKVLLFKIPRDADQMITRKDILGVDRKTTQSCFTQVGKIKSKTTATCLQIIWYKRKLIPLQ